MLTRHAASSLAGAVVCAAAVMGCDSPTRPTPLVPPGNAAPSPATAPRPALQSISPNSGPSGVATAIQIHGAGFHSAAAVTFDGIPVAITGVTSSIIEAVAPARESGSADVVVTNPDGQRASLQAAFSYGRFTVSASPAHVTPRAIVTVSWEVSTERGNLGGGDWVSLYRVADSDVNHGWLTHLNGARSGSVTIPAPPAPGQYEFRYMVNESSVARSNPVTVSATPSP